MDENKKYVTESSIKALTAIYNFEPLKKVRERYEKEGNIIKLPDIKDKLTLSQPSNEKER